MSRATNRNSSILSAPIRRRTLAAGAAWVVPAVTVVGAVPAYAASPGSGDGCWRWAIIVKNFQVEKTTTNTNGVQDRIYWLKFEIELQHSPYSSCNPNPCGKDPNAQWPGDYFDLNITWNQPDLFGTHLKIQDNGTGTPFDGNVPSRSYTYRLRTGNDAPGSTPYMLVSRLYFTSDADENSIAMAANAIRVQATPDPKGMPVKWWTHSSAEPYTRYSNDNFDPTPGKACTVEGKNFVLFPDAVVPIDYPNVPG